MAEITTVGGVADARVGLRRRLATIERLLPAWNLFLVSVGLLSTVTNLLPVVLLPFGLAAVTLVLQCACRVARGEALISSAQFRVIWPFILFVTASFVYAAIIGVDVTNPVLYRREFKFFFSFAWLVIFVCLQYDAQYSVRVLRGVVVGMGLFACGWYVIGRVDPAFLLSHYPTSAAAFGMWEYYPDRPMYLGAFLNHNSAGAFHAIVAILLANFAGGRKWRWVLPVGLAWICAWYLDLSSSRSYILGLLAAGLWSLAADLLWRPRGEWRRTVIAANAGIVLIALVGALPAVRAIYVAASSMLGVDLTTSASSYLTTLLGGTDRTLNLVISMSDEVMRFTGPMKTAHKGAAKMSSDDVADVQEATAMSRLVLAKIAVQDFLGSPFIGVGAARFDNEPRVLASMLSGTIQGSRLNEKPTVTSEVLWNPNELGYIHQGTTRFLDIPLFRINVGNFIAHIDERTHNVYLTVLAEGGLLFFAIFSLMYLRLYRTLGAAAQTDVRLWGIARGAQRVLVCIAVASATTDSFLAVMGVLGVFAISGLVVSVASRTALT